MAGSRTGWYSAVVYDRTVWKGGLSGLSEGGEGKFDKQTRKGVSESESESVSEIESESESERESESKSES